MSEETFENCEQISRGIPEGNFGLISIEIYEQISNSILCAISRGISGEISWGTSGEIFEETPVLDLFQRVRENFQNYYSLPE